MEKLINFFKKIFGIKDKKDGLDKAFRVGEQIPLKGIWFEVEDVNFDELVLKPKSTTAKRMKVIRELKVHNAEFNPNI